MHIRSTARAVGRPPTIVAMSLAVLAVVGAACGGPDGGPSNQGRPGRSAPFTIGAIPDQDPEKLQRLYGRVAGYLSSRLGVKVAYRPVTDYTAAVSLFRSGDLDMVWFGGLTGVQARTQVPGARAIAQRDIDAAFRSVFIAHTSSGVGPVDTVTGLAALKNRRFTFGSESSTSGRLMPEYFLDEAGVAPSDFSGPPGFSGSHDKTIALVETGTYEAGALNEQVWKSRTDAGQVDLEKVRAIFTTPPYPDYHWVLGPDAARRYGPGFTGKVSQALVSLDAAKPEDKLILDLFGAQRFVGTDDDNYRQIEAIARKRGLLS